MFFGDTLSQHLGPANFPLSNCIRFKFTDALSGMVERGMIDGAYIIFRALKYKFKSRPTTCANCVRVPLIRTKLERRVSRTEFVERCVSQCAGSSGILIHWFFGKIVIAAMRVNELFAAKFKCKFWKLFYPSVWDFRKKKEGIFLHKTRVERFAILKHIL